MKQANSISRLYLFLIIVSAISVFLIRFSFIIDQTLTSRFFLTSIILLILFFVLKNGPKINIPLYLLLFFIFYIYSLLSCIWANTFSESIFESQIFFLAFIFVFIFHLSNFEKLLSFFVVIISIISFLGSIMGLIYIFSNSSIEYSDIGLISGNKNLYSAIQFLFIPFILNSFIKSSHLRVWYLIILWFNNLNILLFQTRSIYVSVIISLLIILFFVIFNRKQLHVFSKKNIILVIVYSLLLFMASTAINKNILDKKSRQSFKYKSNLANLEGDKSVNERLLLWKKSSDLIKDNFLLGVGSGNWKIAIGKYHSVQIPWLSRQQQTLNYPHNELIGVFSELGIIGFFLFLFLLLFPIFIFGRHFIKNKKKIKTDLMLFFSFYTGFFIFILVDFPFRRIEHTVLFFLVWYIVIKLSAEKVKIFTFNALVVNMLVFLLLFFNIIVGYYNLKGEYFSRLIFSKERKNNNAVIQYCKEANSIFYKVLSNTLPLHMFEGKAYFLKEDYASALSNFEQALKYTPNSIRVLNNYASTLNNQGRLDEAKEIFRKAIEIDNYYDDAKLNLSIILHQEGKIKEAIDLLEQTEDCAIKSEYLELYKKGL